MARQREPGSPPSSLTRPADEQLLRDVELRIRNWMCRYALEHCNMRTPAIHLYIAKHFRELWEEVPKQLKQEYAEVQARLNVVQVAGVEKLRRIPPKHRTIPMTLKTAAKLLGYTSQGRKPKDAVEMLGQSIRDGIVVAEEQNRQRYVFDKRDFPDASHPKITPKT